MSITRSCASFFNVFLHYVVTPAFPFCVDPTTASLLLSLFILLLTLLLLRLLLSLFSLLLTLLLLVLHRLSH
jgi:hypothetical protein